MIKWLLLGVVLALMALPAGAQTSDPDVARFFDVASLDLDVAASAQAEIAGTWRDGYASMLVDLLDMLQRTGFVDPRGFVQLARVNQFLSAQTRQEFGSDLVAWRRWVWSRPYDPHPAYGEFKGILYSIVDQRMAEFFRPPVASTIRLDEIQWGGVGVNGIPPLDHPQAIAAGEADWLDDDNIVFGISIAGQSRAYPKRILAWHELARDRLGGIDLTIVYCTLCGTVIPFESRVGGALRTFGTSGLLYQSNKLMFDSETASLWSSLTGEPVVGPLVGSGLALQSRPVVTTTWGEWRRRHPDTTVLSVATGFVRDYSEGAAYAAYFGTDALMFDVSRRDGRLPNKAEVLILRDTVTQSGADDSPPLAIAATFLAEHPVYMRVVDDRRLVILTSPGGANRVYAAGAYEFARFDGEATVVDTEGRRWHIDERWLEADFDSERRLPRVPAHRAFWFGWYAQYPDTVLVQ